MMHRRVIFQLPSDLIKKKKTKQLLWYEKKIVCGPEFSKPRP